MMEKMRNLSEAQIDSKALKRSEVQTEVVQLKHNRLENELHRASEHIQILEMKVEVEAKKAALETDSA
eukprot:6166748-Karenia_brevis.AAC.1